RLVTNVRGNKLNKKFLHSGASTNDIDVANRLPADFKKITEDEIRQAGLLLDSMDFPYCSSQGAVFMSFRCWDKAQS
ncbi:hypothetical protein KEM55_000575, partial [Ascosphaera atra]